MKNENNNVIKTIDGVLYYKYDYTDFSYQKLEDYKSRIDKAIEKLESVRIYGLRSGKTLIFTLINDVLDILKGDSDE